MENENAQQLGGDFDETDAPVVGKRVLGNSLDLAPEDDDALDDATHLANILQQLGEEDDEGGFVSTFKEVRNNAGIAEKEYLQKFPVGDFSLETLRELYGAGKYHIRVYRGGGRGIATRKVIRIAKIEDKKHEPQPLEAVAPLVAAMQAGFEKMMQAITTIQQPAHQPQQSRAEILRELQTMQELFGPRETATQPAPQFDPVALLKLGAEMANGGGDGNSAWISKMFDQFGPLLAAKLEAAPTLGDTAAPRLATPKADGEAAPLARSETFSTDQEENPVNIIVAQYLNMLKDAAKKKASVEAYADSIVQMIPVTEIEPLEKMLKADDWREQLGTKTDAIRLYPEWFGQLRDVLLEFIEQDREAFSETLTAGEGAGSVPTHDTRTVTSDNNGNDQ